MFPLSGGPIGPACKTTWAQALSGAGGRVPGEMEFVEKQQLGTERTNVGTKQVSKWDVIGYIYCPTVVILHICICIIYIHIYVYMYTFTCKTNKVT